MHHQHGACNPAFAISGQKVDVIIVGGIGQGAITRLANMGIKVFQAKRGTIKENLNKFLSGELTEISVSSCHSHQHGQQHECNH